MGRIFERISVLFPLLLLAPILIRALQSIPSHWTDVSPKTISPEIYIHDGTADAEVENSMHYLEDASLPELRLLQLMVHENNPTSLSLDRA